MSTRIDSLTNQLPASSAMNRSPAAPSAQALQEKEVFTQFVGESLFGQVLSSMRSTVGQPAYFGGGRAEEIFQGQLDQIMVERITEASADRVAEPMYELFRLNRG